MFDNIDIQKFQARRHGLQLYQKVKPTGSAQRKSAEVP